MSPIKFEQRQLEMLILGKAMQKEFPKIKDLCIYQDSKDNAHPFYRLMQSKLSGLPLRGYYTLKFFHYLYSHPSVLIKKEEKHFYEVQLPLIVEMVIVIQYYHNQILDGKGGVNETTLRNENFLHADDWKNVLYEYVATCPGAAIITKYLSRIFKCVNVGQEIEKKYGTYDQFVKKGKINLSRHYKVQEFIDEEVINSIVKKKLAWVGEGISPQKKEFLTTYFKRIHLTCASLFKLVAQMLMELLDYKDEEGQAKLEKFATYFGMARQVVNDNCDFVPSAFKLKTVAKSEEEAMSDLRNRNITLPLFAYLILEEHKHKDKGVIYDFLQNDGIKDEFTEKEDQYFEDILGTIRKNTIPFGKGLATIAIDFLDKKNTVTTYYKNMAEIADFNKYYFVFYKYEKIKHKYFKKK